MSALAKPSADFLALCAAHGVDPDSIPDAPRVAAAKRRAHRSVPRQRPRAPERQAARDRRRLLGGSNVLPPQLRCAYTQGQTAVLCVIAGEVKSRDVCKLPIGTIASRAGVCRTTVQTTLHEARRLGHLRIEEVRLARDRNAPNVVKVISREWLTWIEHGRARPWYGGSGSNSMDLVSASKTRSNKAETFPPRDVPQGALQRDVRGWPLIHSRLVMVRPAELNLLTIRKLPRGFRGQGYAVSCGLTIGPLRVRSQHSWVLPYWFGLRGYVPPRFRYSKIDS